MLLVLNSDTQSDINMCYDETGIQLAPTDHELTIMDAQEAVIFRTKTGEELHVLMGETGFEFIYIDDPNDNIEQWYSLNNGFVRRLSLKKGASKINGGVDNVVPFPKK